MGRTRQTNVHLPERFYLEHGAYYYRQRDGGRIHLGADLTEAVRRYEAEIGQDAEWCFEKHRGQLLKQARNNAKARGLHFELTIDEMAVLWKRAAGRCELTRIKFSYLKVPTSRRRPWAPSLDRVDVRDGYRIANCRLVCVAVNGALAEFGDEVLFRIAKSLRRARRSIPLNTNLFHAQGT